MREASFHFYSAACRRSERGKKGRRGKVRKKAWPKERGQRASGAALGARKKAVGVLGGDHETSRVIPRWNLVKQSSLETTRTRTLLRGPPGCLIKIEVVRCFSLSLSRRPLPPAPSNLSLSHVPCRVRGERKGRWKRRNERIEQEGTSHDGTLTDSRTCVPLYTDFTGKRVFPPRLHVCPSSCCSAMLHVCIYTHLRVHVYRISAYVCARLFLRLFACCAR